MLSPLLSYFRKFNFAIHALLAQATTKTNLDTTVTLLFMCSSKIRQTHMTNNITSYRIKVQSPTLPTLTINGQLCGLNKN